MSGVAHHLFLIFAHLGAVGLLILGVLDSSFLFMPLGNDLLLVGLTTSHPGRLPYYIPLAALGSMLGCLLLDLVVRKGGEEGLKNRLSAKRYEYVKRKLSTRAGWALAVAALAPPPFPFTIVVGAASAFAYPRWKLLAVIFGTRIVRFTIVGLLAVWLGNRIIALAKTPGFQWVMIAFIVICAIGSAMSIYRWVRPGAPRSEPVPSR